MLAHAIMGFTLGLNGSTFFPCRCHFFPLCNGKSATKKRNSETNEWKSETNKMSAGDVPNDALPTRNIFPVKKNIVTICRLCSCCCCCCCCKLFSPAFYAHCSCYSTAWMWLLLWFWTCKQTEPQKKMWIHLVMNEWSCKNNSLI